MHIYRSRVRMLQARFGVSGNVDLYSFGQVIHDFVIYFYSLFKKNDKKRALLFSELNAFFHFSISILVSLLSLIERNQ